MTSDLFWTILGFAALALIILICIGGFIALGYVLWAFAAFGPRVVF